MEERSRMNRKEAFEISRVALDLAQSLKYHAALRNPKDLKRRIRWFADKTLLGELKVSHAALDEASDGAYELYDLILKWAETYPIEKNDA